MTVEEREALAVDLDKSMDLLRDAAADLRAGRYVLVWDALAAAMDGYRQVEVEEGRIMDWLPVKGMKEIAAIMEERSADKPW